MRLLLLSNSTNPGEPYLGWPGEIIKAYFGDRTKEILFIPFAGVTFSWDDYEKTVADRFSELGYSIKSIHHAEDMVQAVNGAEAIAVGGGNTFNLLATMYDNDLLDPIRSKVRNGMPYIGWSAGSNVACPTIRTTNDMPITEPKSFEALGLVPFQINPHYLDAHPEGHGGETREQRLQEFIEINPDLYVCGIREASALQLLEGGISLLGEKPMRLFKKGQEPKELEPGSDLDFLLS